MNEGVSLRRRKGNIVPHEGGLLEEIAAGKESEGNPRKAPWYAKIYL